MRRVDPHRLQRRVDVALEADRGGDHGAQHAHDPVDLLFEAHDPGLAAVVAAEVQELGDEVPGALAGGDDLLQVAPSDLLGTPVEGHAGELRVPDHARQDVVEVVGDAARELADGGHAARLLELHLEAYAGLVAQAPGRDVPGDPVGALEDLLAVGALRVETRGAHLDPAHLVLARIGELEFEVARRAVPGAPFVEAAVRPLLLGLAEEDGPVLPAQGLRGPAEDRCRARGREGEAALGIQRVDDVGGLVDEEVVEAVRLVDAPEHLERLGVPAPRHDGVVDAPEQVVGLAGLAEVVEGAELEQPTELVVPVLAADDDDLGGRGQGVDLVEHLVARESGHVQVEEHHVAAGVALEEIEHLVAHHEVGHRVPGGHQDLRQALRVSGIVVDDQDAARFHQVPRTAPSRPRDAIRSSVPADPSAASFVGAARRRGGPALCPLPSAAAMRGEGTPAGPGDAPLLRRPPHAPDDVSRPLVVRSLGVGRALPRCRPHARSGSPRGGLATASVVEPPLSPPEGRRG